SLKSFSGSVSYDVSWDGKRLRGTFFMPSTGYTTFSELELIDDHTLSGTYRGDTSGGEEVWIKIRDGVYSDGI
ncbi:MAG TPA: hypothetical protein PKK43_08060, partial [Spirochaetota bacterium]|nr:hypothetical protein [Spirochaetota bacterium]